MSYGYAQLPQYYYHTFDRKNLQYTNIPHRLELEPEPTSEPEPPASSTSPDPSDKAEPAAQEVSPAAAPEKGSSNADAGKCNLATDAKIKTVENGLNQT